jgi:chemotaxis family two-component system sensor kinase Cph1
MTEREIGLSSDGSNVQISGDEVLLRPNAALTFSLVLHELTTNAAKYGALLKPGGFVAIDCRVRSNGGRELRLRWAETGGPQCGLRFAAVLAWS